MRQILTIWKKELRDTIRDRRTVISSVLLPLVLMPVIIVGIGKLTQYQEKKLEEQVVKVAFINPQGSSLEQFIKSTPQISVVEISSPVRDAIKDGVIDIAVELPNGLDTQVKNQTPAEVAIDYDSTKTTSGNALNKLSLTVSAFNDSVLAQRFTDQNIDKKILVKVVPKAADTASEKERGGFGLGFILPLFIVVWSIVGGQYTAVDVSAGEKERKTLESILLTPVSRLEVVLGKFLAVATTASVSVLMSLLSFYAAFALGFSQIGGGAEAGGLSFSVDIATIALLFAVSLLLVLMFSAMQLSLGIFAKSFKEAQSYIGPAYLVVVLPISILNSLPNFKPAAWFFLLPVVNALSLFKELLLGVHDAGHILITVGAMAVYASIMIFITVKIYSKESVLFTS